MPLAIFDRPALAREHLERSLIALNGMCRLGWQSRWREGDPNDSSTEDEKEQRVSAICRRRPFFSLADAQTRVALWTEFSIFSVYRLRKVWRFEPTLPLHSRLPLITQI